MGRALSVFDSSPEVNLAIKESYEISREAFLSSNFLPDKQPQ